MITYDQHYFDKKWQKVISLMPNGGDYRFDLRQYGYDLIKNEIPEGAKVFDYAAGLGVIDIQLEKEKGCKVSGNDFSKVAVEYLSEKSKGNFQQTGEIFGGPYDVVIAIYFLEHIPNPVEWLDLMLDHSEKVICAIPNNFTRNGEHYDMQWTSWDTFYELFKKFKTERIDEGKYPAGLTRAFQHPIITFERKEKTKRKKGKKNAKNTGNRTAEDGNNEPMSSAPIDGVQDNSRCEDAGLHQE
jgi:hypothetical protein